jgi:hypothetical protein
MAAYSSSDTHFRLQNALGFSFARYPEPNWSPIVLDRDAELGKGEAQALLGSQSESSRRNRNRAPPSVSKALSEKHDTEVVRPPGKPGTDLPRVIRLPSESFFSRHSGE